MPAAKKKFPALSEIKKGIKATRTALQVSLKKIKLLTKKENVPLIKSFAQEQKQQLGNLKLLLLKTDQIKKELKAEIKNETILLQRKVTKLEHLQDTLKANAYLLEYKRKDLLLQSDELESINAKIRNENIELLVHQDQIAAQVEELQAVRDEMQEKNREMDERTGVLLDQSDYLYEANQIITGMHQELEKQKDEILNKNEELLNLNQEKNNLIGIVAHDLKSPLNQIKGLVSILKMTAPDDKEADNYLGLIQNSANRLSEMISKILDIEAIESKHLNLDLETINVSASIGSVVERFMPDAERKKITLHHIRATHLQIEADSGYLNQIIENLLSNAIKFSPFSKNIYITETEEQDNVLVRIQDEGPGMTAADKMKLFKKYQKLSARPTGDESSTGLGLSIVKKFVEVMNGKIWCESVEGKGATFIIQFKRTYSLADQE